MNDLVPVTRVIQGHQEEIRTVLRTAHARGRLITDPSTLRATALGDGRHQVTAVMLVPVAMLGRRQRLAHWSARHEIASAALKALAFGAAGSLLIGGVIVTIVLTVTRTVGAPLAGGVLLALALVAGISRVAGKRGRHGHSGWGFHWTKCE